MSAYVLHDANGQAQSIGTVVPSPLPPGLTKKDITDADFDGLRNGTRRWDVPTLAVVVDTAKATAIANQAALADLLAQGMDDMAGILASADPGAGTLTTAALSSIARQQTAGIKLIARDFRRALRELRGDYSGTD